MLSSVRSLTSAISHYLGFRTEPEDDEDISEENAKISLLTSAFSAYLGIPIELENNAKNMQKQGTAIAIPLHMPSSFYTWNPSDVRTERAESGIDPNRAANDIVGDLGEKYGVKTQNISSVHESTTGNQTIRYICEFESWGETEVHPTYYIDKIDLEPSKDFDFTYFKGKRDCERGGYPYERPIGWDRCALRVVNKYGNNVWLGEDGMREKSTPGEWAVSYHGTLATNVRNIAHDGYDDGKSKRQLYGKGIYSTPTLKTAEDMYAQRFTHKGKTYKMVLQNRVNLDKSVIIPASKTGVGAPYYVTQDDGDIRPYGILLKKL